MMIGLNALSKNETCPELTHEQVHHICATFELYTHELGWHTALTGGSLYKRYPRKDIDLIFYQASVGNVASKEELIARLKDKLSLKLNDEPFSEDPHYAIKGYAMYEGWHYALDLFFMQTSLIVTDNAYNIFDPSELAI